MSARVLVVGDTILDHYVFGSVSRVNPEAPHSVVLDYEREEFKLGGACNVAKNLKQLTDSGVFVDYAGACSDFISELLSESMIASFESPTHLNSEILLKTRFVSNNHHILRVDTNRNYSFDNSFYFKVLEKIQENSYDLIIISDYNKGTIYSDFSKKIFETNIPVIFDVKSSKNLPKMGFKVEKYNNVIIKCNKSEFFNEIRTEHICGVNAVIETRGAEGYKIHSDRSWSYKEPEKSNTSVVDVVGAGDTFLAGMAAKYLMTARLDVDEMCQLGNVCASEKVKHFGTYAVTQQEVLRERNI